MTWKERRAAKLMETRQSTPHSAKEAKETTFMVIDNGQFFAMACTLAKTAKKVYYCTPGGRMHPFPAPQDCEVGSGYENIEVIPEVDCADEETDVFVFPDTGLGFMQTRLETTKGVWGSRHAEDLEIDRVKARQIMKKLGLPVIPYEVVHGVDALEKHIAKHPGKWIKLPLYRAIAETFYAVDADIVRTKLLQMRLDLGPKAGTQEFIVEDDFPHAVESGMDSLTVDGRYPKRVVLGVETKGEAYLGQVCAYERLPQAILDFNAAIAPTFKRCQYRGFLSTEHRIRKNGEGPMIDLCPRMGNPPGILMQVLITNWAEIIAAGARGELVEPVYAAKWGAQLQIHSPFAGDHATIIKFPEKYRDYIKLQWSVKVGQEHWIEISAKDNVTVGGAVGVGDTAQEAIDMAKEVAKRVQIFKGESDGDALDKALGEIEQAKEWGVWVK